MLKPSQAVIGLVGIAAVVLFGIFSWQAWQQDARLRQEKEAARALVERWADSLDGQISELGRYHRYALSELPEIDPWGNRLRVSYVQGSASESLEVRSHGPDGIASNQDDLVATRGKLDLGVLGHAVLEQVQTAGQRLTRRPLPSKWQKFQAAIWCVAR